MDFKVDKEKVYKRHGWKPAHGDYSVHKELKGNKVSKPEKSGIASKISSVIKIYLKF